MPDHVEIADVEEYLRDPYLECNYVRMCGGLLRLRKNYTLKNYRRPNQVVLAQADLIKTHWFNLNNKKLDLMVSINCRRDGNIIHLQNKIKYLENLTPEEIDLMENKKDYKNKEDEVRGKIVKILTRMRRMRHGEEDPDEDLEEKLKDADEILRELEEFEKYLVGVDKITMDKEVQTENLIRKKLVKRKRRNYSWPGKVLMSGGDCVHPNLNCYYPQFDEAYYLYNNYDYELIESDDSDKCSVICEDVSSQKKTTELSSFDTHLLHKPLLDYHKMYKNAQKLGTTTKSKNSSPKRTSIFFTKKRGKPTSKPTYYYHPYYDENRSRFSSSPSVTTLFFNTTLSRPSSVRSSYSDTSTYTEFYTQNKWKDCYDDDDEYVYYPGEYENYRKNGFYF